MALDTEKSKDNLSVDKTKMQAPTNLIIKGKKDEKPNALLSHPAVAEAKRGWEDVQVVTLEGKYNLFIKQFIVLLIVFLAARFICGKFSKSRAEIKDKVAAIHIQETNKDDYLDNKQYLLQLEPLFPDISQKNDWLLRQLISLFDAHKITPNVDGNVSEFVEDRYTIISQPVTFQQTFMEIGKLLADIENGDDFLRISEITIEKLNGPDVLGENAVTAIVNTVFPKEKYAPKLFKDYAQQMKKIEDEKKAKSSGKTTNSGGKKK